LKQDNDKNFKITFKRIPCTSTFSTPGIYPYIQFSSLLFSIDVHSTKAGIEHGTAQTHFTRTALCISEFTIYLHSAIKTRSPQRNTLTRSDTPDHILLFAALICCLLHF